MFPSRVPRYPPSLRVRKGGAIESSPIPAAHTCQNKRHTIESKAFPTAVVEAEAGVARLGAHSCESSAIPPMAEAAVVEGRGKRQRARAPADAAQPRRRVVEPLAADALLLRAPAAPARGGADLLPRVEGAAHAVAEGVPVEDGAERHH